MKYVKDSGFVIKRVNVGEVDRYLTIFTQNSGKLEVLAKGVRRIHSKRASHIELLNNIRFQAVKGKTQLVLTEVELVNPYEEVKKNLDTVGCLFLICELVEKMCPPLQKNTQVYDLLSEALENTATMDREKLAYNFEVELLSSLGYWDPRQRFQDADDIKQFIEQIIERKIKSSVFFAE